MAEVASVTSTCYEYAKRVRLFPVSATGVLYTGAVGYVNSAIRRIYADLLRDCRRIFYALE